MIFFFVFSAIVMSIYYSIMLVLCRIKPDINLKQRTKYIIGIAIVLSLLGLNEWRYDYGSETIGSFLEKSVPYTTSYYVLLYPDEKSSQNYKVKADITTFDTEYRDPDYDGKVTSQRNYLATKVYFPNNGFLIFNEDENVKSGLEVGKKIMYYDDKGKKWWIELTNEKAK